MIIDSRAAVTVYLDMMAFMISVGLLSIGRTRKSDDWELKLFRLMCLTNIGITICSIVSFSMYGYTEEWRRTSVLLSRTLTYFLMQVILFEWLLYVDYRLHGSRDHLTRNYKPFFIPMLLSGLCLLVNCFTGFVFTVNPDMHISVTPVFRLIQVVGYFYFLYSIFVIVSYRAKGNRTDYFHMHTMVIPVIAGEILNTLTKYHISPISLSIGLVFLYCSMIEKWRFDDETGTFMNRQYLDYIGRLLSEGKREYRSIMIFSARENPDALAKILEEEKPRYAEMIRVNDKKFVLCMEEDRIAALRMLSDMVSESAEEFDEAQKSGKIGLQVEFQVCGNNEEMYGILQKIT